MKIDRRTNIGVVVSKVGNRSKIMDRARKMGDSVDIVTEPKIVNADSHRRFVKNIFSLREKAQN